MEELELVRICKAGDSVTQGQCPAMYEASNQPGWMVSQGKRLDEVNTAKLQDLAADEAGVMIPVETVLRAVGLYLAERGRPAVMAEVQAFLEEKEGAAA